MNVELAEERILLLADRFTMENAEGRAWAKRSEAFGALARLGKLVSKPKDEDYEVIYRERRLQPFWRLSAHTDIVFERRRQHSVKVAPDVLSLQMFDQNLPAVNKEVTLDVVESCRETNRREWLFDGISKQAQPNLKAYLGFEANVIDAEQLNAQASGSGPCPTVIVPPQAKSSALTREVLSQIMPKIEADRIVEEKVQVEAIDLYYRPVYAFRYRWQGKEAVVEFDAATGEAKAGGATFENYLGKFIDRDFLLDAGVEAANLFLPGANLAKIVIVKGLKITTKN